VETAGSTAEVIRFLGLMVAIISTGGTGTYGISGVYPGITKIQAGSYLLMGDTFLHGVRHGEVEEIFRIEH
jgi:hypothetical protein